MCHEETSPARGTTLIVGCPTTFYENVVALRKSGAGQEDFQAFTNRLVTV